MPKEITKYIYATMQEVNIVKNILSLSNNINMTYNYLTDEISFDSNRIAHILNYYPHISLKNYITTFTLHELGHAIDRENLLKSYDQTLECFRLSKRLTDEEKQTNAQFIKLSFLEDKANLQFELTAWENAILLNHQYNLVATHILDELKHDSLLTYKRNYERSKKLFHQKNKIPLLQ